MKPFESWISERAGTIEDTSTFIKPCSCGAPKTPSDIPKNPAPHSELAGLKLRKAFANMCVPIVMTERNVKEWLDYFRGNKLLNDLISPQNADAYVDAIGDAANRQWLAELREKIDNGESV